MGLCLYILIHLELPFESRFESAGKFPVRLYSSFYSLDLEKSKQGSKNEILELFDRIKKELEDRKKEHDRLSEMLEKENDKRIQEAELIRKRMEKEKQVQHFLKISDTGSNIFWVFKEGVGEPNKVFFF